MAAMETPSIIPNANQERLLDEISSFLRTVENLTPGKVLEDHLNHSYGPGTHYYDTFGSLVKQGLAEGWVANIEVQGRKYRRSRLCGPSERTSWFSVTTVFMDPSSTETQGEHEREKVLLGQYHKHPYGEINCVIPIDEGAELRGLAGWMGKGWPLLPSADDDEKRGSHHYPEARRGALVALFFLPAGRISYDAKPEDAKPDFV
ncbi:p-hydroxylaminobenzoate lyase [Phlyctema vagabunda]|uniref:p-hydroxylaminobenzoate lyase n=1 Tax=Phlyctema vagabunda TaxID=108571 RepID=A0ABR4PMT7_9HELO